MINNPLIQQIEEHRKKARLTWLKEKKSGNISKHTDISVSVLSTLIGEFERKMIGEHRPDISEHRARGIYKGFYDNINQMLNSCSNNEDKEKYQIEINVLESLGILPKRLTEQEISLQIVKLHKELIENSPHYKTADNQKYLLEINFYKRFVPTSVDPSVVNIRISNFFSNKK